MRHNTLIRAGAAFAAVGMLTLAGCSSSSLPEEAGATGPSELDHLKIQLDFQPRGLHSVLYVGDAMGFFEDAGVVIDSVTPGKSSGETLQVVSSLTDTIGVADLPTLVLNQSKGVPVKAIGVLNQQSPLSMCSLKENVELHSPDDLRGLTISVQASGSTYLFTKALLAANGIAEDELEWVTVNPPYENYLLTGQVDVVPCYEDAELTILADHAGGADKISILDGPEYGYDAYGTGVFASDALIEQNPEAVEKFMKGFTEAFQYVIDNPEEAAEVIAASSPELAENAELYTAQIQADIAESFTSTVTEESGLGAMDDATWEKTIGTLADQGQLESVPTVDDVRDASFIDAANAE
ncbi:ABC transporter substrate-binding protein [Microbacterium marinilacus]|uniref:ABC transporter substrate-binding protein n=1 Tax=Microbacterium marinilacus TaxID=415209 RepID=A0ABP7BEQ8_9MICO|nr:ABC transporter substrate-binding protein [Microbacterium marinilacus]MBY0689647.1 ABC transporter substrate-binding protein [Microbacterium marinilacus]